MPHFQTFITLVFSVGLLAVPSHGLPAPQGSTAAPSSLPATNTTTGNVEELVVTGANTSVEAPALNDGELAILGMDWGKYLGANETLLVVKTRERGIHARDGEAHSKEHASLWSRDASTVEYSGNASQVIRIAHPPTEALDQYLANVARPEEVIAFYQPGAASPNQQRRDVQGQLPSAALQELGWKLDQLVASGPIFLFRVPGPIVNNQKRDVLGLPLTKRAALTNPLDSRLHLRTLRSLTSAAAKSGEYYVIHAYGTSWNGIPHPSPSGTATRRSADASIGSTTEFSQAGHADSTSKQALTRRGRPPPTLSRVYETSSNAVIGQSGAQFKPYQRSPRRPGSSPHRRRAVSDNTASVKMSQKRNAQPIEVIEIANPDGTMTEEIRYGAEDNNTPDDTHGWFATPSDGSNMDVTSEVERLIGINLDATPPTPINLTDLGVNATSSTPRFSQSGILYLADSDRVELFNLTVLDAFVTNPVVQMV